MPTICTWQSCTIKYQEHLEAAALAVLASQWRPVTEPPEGELQRVLLCGGDVARIDQFNRKAVARTHWMPIPPLPQPPIDPYAELRKAHAAGKVIEVQNDLGVWKSYGLPIAWTFPVERYRIKPWSLSRHLPGFRALEPGESYHREDFTEEMLPDGWRPALMNEEFDIHGDCEFRNESGGFMESSGKAFPSCRHTRTRRPLPPTKQELERKEFEEWSFNAGYGCSSQQIRDTLFVAWQAARKQKESK